MGLRLSVVSLLQPFISFGGICLLSIAPVRATDFSIDVSGRYAWYDLPAVDMVVVPGVAGMHDANDNSTAIGQQSWSGKEAAVTLSTPKYTLGSIDVRFDLRGHYGAFESDPSWTLCWDASDAAYCSQLSLDPSSILTANGDSDFGGPLGIGLSSLDAFLELVELPETISSHPDAVSVTDLERSLEVYGASWGTSILTPLPWLSVTGDVSYLSLVERLTGSGFALAISDSALVIDDMAIDHLHDTHIVDFMIGVDLRLPITSTTSVGVGLSGGPSFGRASFVSDTITKRTTLSGTSQISERQSSQTGSVGLAASASLDITQSIGRFSVTAFGEAFYRNSLPVARLQSDGTGRVSATDYSTSHMHAVSAGIKLGLAF